METGQSVTILVGDHKGEPGVIVRTKGQNAIEVLTLAGHSHIYTQGQLKAEEMRPSPESVRGLEGDR